MGEINNNVIDTSAQLEDCMRGVYFLVFFWRGGGEKNGGWWGQSGGGAAAIQMQQLRRPPSRLTVSPHSYTITGAWFMTLNGSKVNEMKGVKEEEEEIRRGDGEVG